MEVRPLEHQLHREVDPGLGAVAHHQHRSGKSYITWSSSSTFWHSDGTRGPAIAHGHEQRHAELDALGVQRVHARRVDGDLWRQPVGEDRHRTHIPRGVGGDEVADVVHPAVGIGRVRRDETMRVVGERTFGRLGRGGEADQADLDAEAVHLGERHRHRVRVGDVFRHVVEHVRRRHRERSFDSVVAEQLLAHRRVQLFRIDREPDHRVDDADRWLHAVTAPPRPTTVTLARSAILILTSMSNRGRQGHATNDRPAQDAEGPLHHAPKHPDHRRSAGGAALAEGRRHPRPTRRLRQGGVRGDRLPRDTHLRHRHACRDVARDLLPLLRFEGADLPRGRRGPGSPAHRPRRRRRTRRPTRPSSTASCVPTVATSSATGPTAGSWASSKRCRVTTAS